MSTKHVGGWLAQRVPGTEFTVDRILSDMPGTPRPQISNFLYRVAQAGGLRLVRNGKPPRYEIVAETSAVLAKWKFTSRPRRNGEPNEDTLEAVVKDMAVVLAHLQRIVSRQQEADPLKDVSTKQLVKELNQRLGA